MNNETKDYLTRLIAGTREMAEKEYGEYDGEPTIPAKWMDAVLLCDVVEKELLTLDITPR